MLPLNVIGKLSSIISISFRLFGNIFGGAIITKLYFGAIGGSIILELLGLLSGLNFLIVAFFTLFEGLLQAFVFAMLTLTYLALSTQEGGH
jgi:F-type H+-transporting ATPase subunit a